MFDELATVELVGGSEPIEANVVTRGEVGPEAVDYAMKRMATVVEDIDEAVLFARVKLSTAPDPACKRPAVAQVTLDIGGEMVRAQVAAHEMHAAIDLLQRRLRDKLQHRAERRAWLRTQSGTPDPGHWRHGDLPTDRPVYFDRPRAEREIVRHKTLAVDELTLDEAAFDLDQLGYGFYLFRDIDTGEDALIEHGPDRSYRLTRLHSVARGFGPTAVPIDLSGAVVPVLSVADALAGMEMGRDPFMFFADATTRRGCVVYHRYDGHYGLITLE